MIIKGSKEEQTSSSQLCALGLGYKAVYIGAICKSSAKCILHSSQYSYLSCSVYISGPIIIIPFAYPTTTVLSFDRDYFANFLKHSNFLLESLFFLFINLCYLLLFSFSFIQNNLQLFYYLLVIDDQITDFQPFFFLNICI